MPRVRRAIRTVLSSREDIAVVGEASNFRETIQKTAELHPALIMLDVNMPDRDHIAPSEVRSLLKGTRVLAMTFGTDDIDEGLLDSVGAGRLLDKMDLADQLLPAILELAEARTAS